PRTLLDRLVNGLPAEHGPEGRVAGTERLPNGDDVGLDGELVGGQPRPDPADARHHLVEADQEAVLLTALVQPSPEPLGRRVAGKGGRADRLAEERGDRLRARLLEEAIQLLKRALAAGVESPRARR